MVSQTPNGEWEPPGSGFSAAGVRTPPSYVDAVRSRHSMSQSDTMPPVTDRSLKYNSLPRPQPQRLQACIGNGAESSKMHCQWSEVPPPQHFRPPPERNYHPMDSTRGFQVYTKPPGPANHVPLSSSSSNSNTASLPRCFPRTMKMMESHCPPSSDHFAKDLQQPLSIIVQQGDYPKKLPPKADGRTMMQDSRWVQPPQVHNRQMPFHRPPRLPHRDFAQDRNGHPQRSTSGMSDPRKHPVINGHRQPPAYYQQPPPQNFGEAYHRANNARYSKGGIMHPQDPRREILPEPVVSLRTGPLGSYPDSPSHNPVISSPPGNHHGPRSFPEMDKNQGFVPFHEIQQPRNRNSSHVMEPSYPQQQQQIHRQSTTNLHQSSGSTNDAYPLYENREELLQGMACQKSSTLPIRKTASDVDGPNHRPILLQQSPLMNGRYTPDQPSPLHQTSRQYCLPMSSPDSQRFTDLDYYQTTSRSNNCQTPEEAGLVMIVESRDLNSQVKSVAKDVVKPRPRIPVSPSSDRGYLNQSFSNGPNPTRNSSGSDDCPRVSQMLKPSNGQLLRRTPLSSSNASLNSEMSSVSSRHRPSQKESAQKRLSANSKLMREGKSNSTGEKSKKEISPSPWTREEKEKLQKQQMEGARRARDDEIEFLESLGNRTAKQEEWLRILLLEREFQRRAEEVGDDEEDDDEDEAMLERAENRERMLIIERDRDGPLANSNNLLLTVNGQKSITSSSDHWLLNSQAKQRHRSNESSSSAHNSSGTFEVQQFNDLLETMNMSPVIRNSREDVDKLSPSPRTEKYSHHKDEDRSCTTSSGYYPAQPMSSNVPMKANSSLAGTCADFCYPVDEPLEVAKGTSTNECITREALNQKIIAERSMSCDYENIAKYKNHGEDSSGKNTIRKEDAVALNGTPPYSFASQIDDGAQPKVALRVPLSMSSKQSPKQEVSEPKDGSHRSVFENGKTRSPPSDKGFNGFLGKKSASSEKISEQSRSWNVRHENDKYVRNRMTSSKPNVRPVSDSSISQFRNNTKVSNGLQRDPEELEDKSPEYKKIWSSKPEKLTFLDKIKKFSLQAGDDDVPRDKVKNSRAQRELEIKFNGDSNRTTVQPKTA